jgi:uncharacterized protein
MTESLAIVGSGIAGLGCAYLLRDRYRLTIFEKNDYSGGHTNTISLAGAAGGAEVAFDTGFMVFNHVTYPLLTELFKRLDVSTKKTDMSFSVQYLPAGIEWNGAGLDKVFAQRSNLVSPRFWRMLRRLDWFNKNAPQHLERSALVHQTVREYVQEHDLGEDFLNWYLVPMGASVWSTPPGKMLDFPVAALIRFFHNHGFLGLDTHYQWYTVDGGAKKYVQKISAALPGTIRHKSPVRSVERMAGGGAMVVTDAGTEKFDKVILACHADEALALLQQPLPAERDLLMPFKYQENQITVHSDAAVMPRRKKAWASWNYRVARPVSLNGPYGGAAAGEGSGEAGVDASPTLHYWMNSLQGVGNDIGKNYFVSLNSDDLIDEALVHRRLNYTHPLFDLATFSAQDKLASLNTISADQSVYFCGSYFKNGFHEDAFRSACELATTILGREAFG